jgi:3-oxoacyl-[acyl-carrier protein] reductase
MLTKVAAMRPPTRSPALGRRGLGQTGSMDLGLHGRTVLITASYRGTGRGIARVFAAEGANVIVHGFDLESAEVVAAEWRAAGGSARAVAGDLLTDAGADELMNDVGPVDILIANYGVAEGGSWFGESTDEAAWFDSYNKNVLAAVRLVRRCTPSMRAQQWGRIVLLGTVGSLRPGTRQPQYYAAKAALPAITTSLAKELSGTGITVNLVSPGIIATDEVRERFTARAAKLGKPTDWESVQRLIFEEFMDMPTKRVPFPEDVGNLVAFLASDRAASISGANYRIDGGSADAVTA